MASEKVLMFGDTNFDTDVLQSEIPVLVDFWATWCAPCKAIAPVIDAIADEYEGKIKIGKVNVDDNPNTPSKYGVRGIPTVILFKEGKVVDQVVGAVPKAQLDALLLKLPGVSAMKINGLDAYFVGGKMFVCISGDGVGLRLPAATATELQFSRDNVVPFQPGGMASSREWIQIDRADAADYEKDLQLFLDSLEFVKATRTR